MLIIISSKMDDNKHTLAIIYCNINNCQLLQLLEISYLGNNLLQYQQLPIIAIIGNIPWIPDHEIFPIIAIIAIIGRPINYCQGMVIIISIDQSYYIINSSML